MPLFNPITNPVIISNEGANLSGAVTTVLVGSTVYLFAFEVPGSIIIIGARWHMGLTATGTTNMAIYTFAGNIISNSDTGAVTNVASSDVTSTYGTPIVLSAGQYFMALACSNSTDTYLGRGSASNAAYRGRKATNALAAGALPLTTGAFTSISTQPACALLVQGGLG